MVAVYNKGDDKYVLGAAVLLAHTWAISALVAVKGYEWKDLVLSFGEYDTEKKDGPVAPFSVAVKDVRRQEVITCCDQPVLIGFDDIRYSFVVSPICLPEKTDPDPYDQPAIIAGWGGYSFTKRSKVIREEMVKMVSWEICKDLLDNVGKESEAEQLDQKYICSSNQGQSNSVCNGDYGGPLMYFDNDKQAWVIVGILTNVIDCFEQPTNVPGVYMYVKEHIEWITETLKKPCCAQKSMDSANSSSIPNELDSGL